MPSDLYTLSTDKAEVTVSTFGGCLHTYRLTDGFDILRPHSGTKDTSSLFAASFPLIPYSNRIKEGRFRFRGKDYELPLNFGDHPHSIHGVGWDAHWTAIQPAENTLILDLIYTDAGWPFAFTARQKFTICGSALRHEIEITNRSGSPMPVGLGMHPFFPRHGNAVLTADVEVVWLNDHTCLPIKRVAVPTSWDLRRGQNVARLNCDNLFEPWDGDAQIHWPDTGRSVVLSAAKDLKRLVVYSPKGEDYFCVEPVSHMTDAFNRSENGMPSNESGMRILENDENWSVWMQFDPC